MQTLEAKVSFELILFYQDVDGIILRDIEKFNKEIGLLDLTIADDYQLQKMSDKFVLKYSTQSRHNCCHHLCVAVYFLVFKAKIFRQTPW